MGLFGGKKGKDKDEPVQAPAPQPRAPEPIARAPEPTPAPRPAPTAAAPAPAAAPTPQYVQDATPPEAQINETLRTAPAAANLTQEQIQQAIGQSQQAFLAVGHIMTFLMNVDGLRDMPIGQVRALIIPAVLSQQFLVAMGQSQQTGHVTPIGLALWANVSDEIHRRLEQEKDQPYNLTPPDWTSGNNTWMIMLAGDRRAIGPLVVDMQKRTMGGRPIKVRVENADGSVRVEDFAYTEGA